MSTAAWHTPSALEESSQIAEFGRITLSRLNPPVHLAHHVGVRHAGVLENEFRVLVKTPAYLVVHLAHAKARRIRRHQEERAALRDGGVRVRSAVDEEELGHAAVGDVALASVQHPLVPIAQGLKLPARPGVVRGHAVVRTRRLLGSAFSEKIGVVLQERLQEPVFSDHPCRRRLSGGSTSSTG